MFEKILAGLVACLALMSILFACLICYCIWPDKDSSLPAWVQAIGAIAAVLCAGGGIVLQLRHAERGDAKRRATESMHTLRAIGSEIKSYTLLLRDISLHMENDFSLLVTRRLQISFPPINLSFPIYSASGPMIGAIANNVLRDSIVTFYGETDAFFAALNRNSAAAELIPHDSAPEGGLAKALLEMGPQLENKIKRLLDLADTVNKELHSEVLEIAKSANIIP